MNTRLLFSIFAVSPIAGLAADKAKPAASPELAELTLELSPFVVTTTQDTGYVATSSLAGTRLNTDLRDIGAAIQVVTKDLMEDLAATSYNDVLLFTTSTETAGLGGNFSGANFPSGDRVNSDAVLNDPAGANRVRGLAAPDRTRDYFLTSIPFDSYNSDRVDISRGANSILFGLGSPSGVVNQSMLRAGLRKNATELRFQNEIGETNNLSSRVSLDQNTVLAKDRVAFRFAALRDNQNFQQQPANREQRRITGAVTVKLHPTTTLRAGFESGRVAANNPDALAPAESISNYLIQLKAYQAASAALRQPVTNLPLYADPFNIAIRNTAAYRTPNVVVPGFVNPLVQQGTNLFKNIALVYDNASSRTPAYAFQTAVQPGDVLVPANYVGSYPVPPGFAVTGNIATAQTLGVRNIGQDLPGWSTQALTDFSIFDFSRHLLAGTAGKQTQNFNTGNVVLEHTLKSGRAGLELAYDRQRMITTNANPFRGANGAIRLDLNRTITTGGDNPNFGRPFIIDRLNLNDTKTETAAFRATAFGKLDFTRDFLAGTRLGRWLGQHTLTGLFSTQDTTTRSTTVQEAWNAGGDARINALLDASIGVKQFQRQVAYIDYIGPAVNLLANPAALKFTDFQIANRAVVNQAIPSPGGVVPVAVWSNISPVRETYPLTRAPYVRNGSLKKITVDSVAAVLQSRLVEDMLVSTVGWREDKQRFANNNNPPVDPADASGQSFTTSEKDFTLDGIPTSRSRGSTLSTSFVGRLPKRWRDLPGGTEVSAFVSKSDNLQPDPGRLDQYQHILPAPAGKTREIGLNVVTLHGKVHLRVNRYDSAVTGITNGRLGGLFNNALIESTFREIQFMYDDIRGASLSDPAVQRVVAGSNAIAGLYGARIDPVARTITVNDSHPYAKTWRAANPSLVIAPNGTLQSFFYTNPPNLADTQDSKSAGYEGEIVFNPTRGWRMLLNVAKQETQTANSLPNLAVLLKDFTPVMYGAPGAPSAVGALVRGNPLSSTSTAATNAEFWNNSVQIPYAAVTSLDGTTSPEQRKWRANFVTNYEFTGERLKGFSVGANVRWQDRVAIGYPLITDRVGNLVPDRARPYLGPTETAVGFRAGYRRSLFQNRVQWNLSFNLQNAFSHTGDLIPVLAQPDGSIAQMRTAPPRSLVMTNSFKF